MDSSVSEPYGRQRGAVYGVLRLRVPSSAVLLDQDGDPERALPFVAITPSPASRALSWPDARWHGRGGTLDSSVAVVQTGGSKRPATRIMR